MCLSWWAPVALSATQQVAFAEARDDVAWVFGRLLVNVSNAGREAEMLGHATPSKRRAAESDDAIMTKRQRT
jgi:hypothetical protein